MPDDLTTLSAGEAVSAMRDGRMTALAYAEALLARCAAGADLNAFIALDPDAVRAAARAADARRAAGEPLGPLHGLPVPVKDSIATADLPTTAGTTALRDFRPAHDAGIVARLRAAGASVLGKTNLHELSMGWSSNNQAFGAVRNPWDRTRIPGGSSGGTAAAVAAGMAPLGLAEDTQGSIRVPAALCGIAGFRPTTGRYPSDGCAPISPLFDQIGPHARCVADLALFDAVITGEDAPLDPLLLDGLLLNGLRLNGLRLGIVRDYYFDGIDPAVAAVVETALGRLADAGVTLVETEFPGLGTLIAAITSAVQAHDVVPSLTAWLEAMGAPVGFDAMFAQVSPDVATLLRQIALPGAPHATSEAAYAAARDVHRPALQAQFAQWFADNRVDAMILPATMTTATPIGEDDHLHIAGRDVPFRFAMGRNIAPGSTAGLPGLVLPAGLANGLPVAIEIDGPAGSDRAVLAMGRAIEGVLGTLPLR